VNPIKEELKKKYINQIKEIVEDYNKIVVPIISSPYDPNTEKHNEIHSIITRVITAIERVTTKKSVYYIRAEELLKKNDKDQKKVAHVIGVLEGLYKDLDADYLKSLSEIIHADIFSDYIDMAEYLLDEGYKDPAAVITGSTLEEHLRKLCLKNGIDIEIMSKGKLRPKKAGGMNSELAKERVYSKLEQKNVTAWLDLRNKAAHGKYNEYNDNQVKQMILGVRGFIVRNPA
jgi:hypothetical protein